MSNIAKAFLSDPRPVYTSPDAGNPALPFPAYQMHGAPNPRIVPPPTQQWDKARPWPFPSMTLVRQPRNITSIA